jgi:class 3 adenylate cyclase
MPKHYSFYDDVRGLERYLNLPAGGLSNIPIYARVPAVDAIIKVREMEAKTQFRPGLYYIVLADLRGNTTFNAKYGNAEGDVRVEWFQTTVVQTIGELDIQNYVAFSKTVGDAALLIFSSFADVFAWSKRLTANLAGLVDEYPESLEIRGVDVDLNVLEQQTIEFDLKARRLVHIGEVSYSGSIDPLSLAVSQTFKIEKAFDKDELGCTQAVHDVAAPLANSLGVEFLANSTSVTLAGHSQASPTYYVVTKGTAI